jgi:hypothetical protein
VADAGFKIANYQDPPALSSLMLLSKITFPSLAYDKGSDRQQFLP